MRGAVGGLPRARPGAVAFRRPATTPMRLSIVLALLVAGTACAQVPAPAPTPAERPVTLDQTPRRTDGPRPAQRTAPRNVILMIADGFGPASATLGAAAKGAPLAFDSLLVGSVETSSTSSRVADSAASGTAYACGLKSYNGAIAVDTLRRSCQTVLEAAEARGMASGLVTTSRITHATPASFAAHVAARSAEAEIALQLAASGVDVLFGGGGEYFGSEADSVFVARGGTVARDRAGFNAITSLPAGAILAYDHLAYEIDRDETDQPSLAEMATLAIDLLSAEADEAGFFLMVEGGRIDHAAHDNDPAGHLRDILAYDEAVAAVLAWSAADRNTLLVLTADHETGGMTLGRDGVYRWDPAPLLRATGSFDSISEKARAGRDLVDVIRETLGYETLPGSTAEAIQDAGSARDGAAIARLLDQLASEPAGIGWTTTGHTAVDVGLYAFGPGASRFGGRMANDAVGRALFEAMGLRGGE